MKTKGADDSGGPGDPAGERASERTNHCKTSAIDAATRPINIETDDDRGEAVEIKRVCNSLKLKFCREYLEIKI